MGINEQDTDPSTPAALAMAPTDPSPRPGAAKVSTDPGIGPASQPAMDVTVRMPSTHKTPPMGIIVPSSYPVKSKKDSVELLLDGMQANAPERPKTMPQTDGQSSASYHAEHLVRPARTSPDEEPKVVVERGNQAVTTKVDRATVQSVIEQAEARRRANEATAFLPQPVAPRVVVAIVAAVTVVLGLFVVLRLALGHHGDDTAASAATSSAQAHVPPVISAAAPAMPGPGPTPMTTPASTAAATTSEPAPTATEAPAATTATPRSAAPTAQTTKPAVPTLPSSWGPYPRIPRAAPTATSHDLGEFKTTYH